MGGAERSVDDFASLLWRVREALEHVTFKVDVLRLLLASAVSRWVAAADGELAAALADLRAIEVVRAAEADALGARLGLRSAPTLSAIAEAAGEPWTTILGDHAEQLRRLVADLETATVETRRLLDAAAGSSASAGAATEFGSVYSPYEAALETTAGTRQVSLLAFLGADQRGE